MNKRTQHNKSLQSDARKSPRAAELKRQGVINYQMENSITITELLVLLLIFWGPIFVIALFIQSRFLRKTKHRWTLLFFAFTCQVFFAFAIWVSPIHKIFINLNFLGGFAIGSLPLQAGLLSVIIVTLIIWGLSRSNVLNKFKISP